MSATYAQCCWTIYDFDRTPLPQPLRPADCTVDIARLSPVREPIARPGRGGHLCDLLPRQQRQSGAQALAVRTGFEVVDIDRIEGRPEYLRMTALTYLIGAVYERLVNLTPRLARFRVLLAAELRKADAGL